MRYWRATTWTGEPWKHAKWKMSDTKSHTCCGPLCVKCPWLANLWRRKVNEWLPRTGGGSREWGWLLTGMGVAWGWQDVLRLVVVMVVQLCRYSLQKAYELYLLNRGVMWNMSYTSIKLFKNEKLGLWLVWLNWLGIIPQRERSLVHSQSGHVPGLWVPSPVRACARGNRSMFLSLSPSLPLSLKIDK